MATFKELLKSIKASGKALQGNVQNALVIAMEHYSRVDENGVVCGDTQKLTDLMEVANSVRTINTKTLQAFIQAHANVTWSKLKNKNGDVYHAFKKVGKEVEVQEITSQWYMFTADGVAEVKPMDCLAQAKALLSRINKSLAGEDGKSVKDEDQARRLSEALAAITA